MLSTSEAAADPVKAAGVYETISTAITQSAEAVSNASVAADRAKEVVSS